MIKRLIHFSDLHLKLNSKRKITDIVIVGYDKFPNGIKKAIKTKKNNAKFRLKRT